MEDKALSPEEQRLQKAIETFKPYIYELERRIQKMKFGQIDATIRFHDGFVSDVVFVSKERHKFAMPERGAVMPQEWQPKRVEDVPPIVDQPRTTSYHSDKQPS